MTLIRPKKVSKRWCQLFMMVIVLNISTLVNADTIHRGTANADKIYFGCVETSPGIYDLRIYQKSFDGTAWTITADKIENMDGQNLHIYGRGQNDHIEAVDNQTIDAVNFDGISNLNYQFVYLRGQGGNDTIIGTPGRDTIYGGSGDDHLKGLGDRDYIYGQGGIDKLEGGDNDDNLYGGSANDWLIGCGGNDRLYGDSDDDYMEGSRGNDRLFGGPGNDFLVGDQDNDRLRGGTGDDILLGGTGHDRIIGDDGIDTFYGRRAHSPTIYDPVDHESDWNDWNVPTARVEHAIIRDPYTDWALMLYHSNGVTYQQYTTSNPDLLFDDMDLGARILLNDRSDPIHTIHKQYGISCGPSSLSMVMDYLRLSEPTMRSFYPRNLDEQEEPSPVSSARWPATAVDVGYYLSMEHIIYEDYHRNREIDRFWEPNGNGASDNVMDGTGRLNTDPDVRDFWEFSFDGTIRPLDGEWYHIDYDLGHPYVNPITGTATVQVSKWLGYGGLVAWDDGLNYQLPYGQDYTGLPYVANRFAYGMPDAKPVPAEVGLDKPFVSFEHLKDVIKGFIDHRIPLVVAVEAGGHFNTLIGYWEIQDEFWVYLADPLDGWGRPFYKKPMRWKKLLLTPMALKGTSEASQGEVTIGGSRTFDGLMLYGYSERGYYGGDYWARDLDDLYAKDAFGDHLPDTAFIDRASLRVRNIRGDWVITDRMGIVYNFEDKEHEARLTLDIIRFYGMDRIVFSNRPNPGLEFLLAGGRPPEGSMRGEDCYRFNPKRLEIGKIKGKWRIYERLPAGLNWLFAFDSEQEAYYAYDMIMWYRFDHTCDVGRRDPHFSYLRR